MIPAAQTTVKYALAIAPGGAGQLQYLLISNISDAGVYPRVGILNPVLYQSKGSKLFGVREKAFFKGGSEKLDYMRYRERESGKS